MAAGVQRFQLEVGVDFFAGLNGGEQAMVALFFELASVESIAQGGLHVEMFEALHGELWRLLRRRSG